MLLFQWHIVLEILLVYLIDAFMMYAFVICLSGLFKSYSQS